MRVLRFRNGLGVVGGGKIGVSGVFLGFFGTLKELCDVSKWFFSLDVCAFLCIR